MIDRHRTDSAIDSTGMDHRGRKRSDFLRIDYGIIGRVRDTQRAVDLQQRATQEHQPDREIDNQPGDVDERGDKRRGRSRWIEAEAAQ